MKEITLFLLNNCPHCKLALRLQEELLEEPMCNPIAQAQLLNRAQTQLNICLGLCVGHDSLFYK